MLKMNTFIKKVIATILLFIIVFSNSTILLNECVSLAAVNEYGKQTSKVSVANISFDSTFVDNNEVKGYTYQTSVDNQGLAVKLNLEVKDAGYLKNATIRFESDSKLNFEIGQISGNDLIEVVRENEIKLNQINYNEKLDLLVPIKYVETELVDNLKNDTQVILNGTYVNNNGSTTEINEKVVMNLAWISNSKVTITSELAKFVKFNSEDKKGIIAQTLVTIGLDKENMPIAKTEVILDALKIDGLELEKVTVISNERTEFTDENWNFDSETGKINITVSNDEVVANTETFIITYVLCGENEINFPIELTSNIETNIYMKGTAEKISGVYNALYTVSEQIGDIVTYTLEAITEEITKGNIIANKYKKDNSYLTEYGYKYIINIADTTLLDKIVLRDINEDVLNEDGRLTLEETSYYKNIKVLEKEFKNILGDDGILYIKDLSGNEIATVTTDTEVIDGYYVVTINPINKISIETSKPINTGNLEILVNKEIVDTEYSIEQIKEFISIVNKISGSIYFEGNVENTIGIEETEIKLSNTTTSAKLSLDRYSLGTIVKNEDVELKVEFNNNKVGTDFYKNPIFEIKLPENIKEVTINKVSVINADNAFKIKDINAKYVGENIVITVELEGTQTEYSLNNLTNGTNLLINTDMTLDEFTPSEDSEIVLNYTNAVATSYENVVATYGTSVAEVSYTAPDGVVSVNTVSNYNDENTEITSVKQGVVIDKIEIYDEAKISKVDLLVMNNNNNIVKDVKLLGRIPFEGNTDIQTGAELGTTLNTKLIGNIVSNSENKASATIYYSENGLATTDLTKTENGWSTTILDLSKIKSFLIVLDENYEMNKGEVLKFSYEYEIPGNLEHNEELYSTFARYYTDVTEVSSTSEVSVADKVGLTTGQGPKLALETSVNIGEEDVNEYEYIKYSITAKNTGTEDAEEVIINVPLPEGTTFAKYTPTTSVENLGGWSLLSDLEKTYNVGTLAPDESKTYEFYVQVNELPTIEEYYANYEGFTKNDDGTYSLYTKVETEDGEEVYEETKIASLPDVYTKFVATVTAKDLAKPLTSNTTANKINESEVVTSEMVKTETVVVNINEKMTYDISMKNATEKTMKDIKIEKILPEEISYVEAYVVGYEDDGITVKKINTVAYNKESRKVTWTISSLDAGRTIHVKLVVKTNDLPENVYESEIVTNSTVKVNGKEYKTGELTTKIGKPKLVISQVADVTNKYVKEGQIINYTFTIKNEGLVKAKKVSVVDNLPEQVKVKSLTYVTDGIEMKKVVAKNDDATVYTSIQPNNELVIKVKAVTLDIEKEQETISNYATVIAENSPQEQETNIVTHIIENAKEVTNNDENPNGGNGSNGSEGGQNGNKNNDEEQDVATYKITGSAWLDTDRDGQYTKNDRMVSNLEVMLINASTGKQITKTVTSGTGTYTFDGLESGKYYTAFYYNSKKYGLTEYKKNGVAENLNSDAYVSDIDGRTVGLTDIIVIKDTSISNVDVGLIEAKVFDLSLEKNVAKITVKNNGGTTKTLFNDEMAKIDIPAKYLSSSKVYIEYKITIKNEGELIGYAKEVVDYLDKGLSFSQDLNKDWYKGSDGNLYSKALANKAIVPGEKVELTLVLTKQMTENNTGMINNTAEITKAYNAAGISDKDSTPKNKVQSEDDYGVADVIISVKTGESLIYISGIIIAAVTAMIIGYVLYKKKDKIKQVFKTRKVVD